MFASTEITVFLAFSIPRLDLWGISTLKSIFADHPHSLITALCGQDSKEKHIWERIYVDGKQLKTSWWNESNHPEATQQIIWGERDIIQGLIFSGCVGDWLSIFACCSVSLKAYIFLQIPELHAPLARGLTQPTLRVSPLLLSQPPFSCSTLRSQNVTSVGGGSSVGLEKMTHEGKRP